VVSAERFRGIVVTLADDDAGIVQGIASAEILAAREHTEAGHSAVPEVIDAPVIDTASLPAAILGKLQ
jgi:hypothetical protein